MDIGHVLSLVLFPCDTSASLNSFNSFSYREPQFPLICLPVRGQFRWCVRFQQAYLFSLLFYTCIVSMSLLFETCKTDQLLRSCE